MMKHDPCAVMSFFQTRVSTDLSGAQADNGVVVVALAVWSRDRVGQVRYMAVFRGGEKESGRPQLPCGIHQ